MIRRECDNHTDENSSQDLRDVQVHIIVTREHQFVSFFFQAEDGIRDYKVTGVQTCALPILLFALLAAIALVWFLRSAWFPTVRQAIATLPAQGEVKSGKLNWQGDSPQLLAEIGRASCRGRG